MAPEASGFRESAPRTRVGNPGCNNTKSAFADYASRQSRA